MIEFMKTVEPREATAYLPPSWLERGRAMLPHSTEQHRRVPSLWHFVQGNDSIDALASSESQKMEILGDLEVYEMRSRRMLVKLLNKVNAYNPKNDPHDDRFSSFGFLLGDSLFKACNNDSIDIETLRQQDPTQIAALNNPTAIFQLNHSFTTSAARGYPLHFSDTVVITDAVRNSYLFHNMATKLLARARGIIGIEDPSMEDLRGLMFRCGCCPSEIHRVYTWETLVSGTMTP